MDREKDLERGKQREGAPFAVSERCERGRSSQKGAIAGTKPRE